METERQILTIAELQHGDHLCFIYETEEEHRAVITPFLRRGLEGGEKVLYIVDSRTAGAILDYLRRDGVKVDEFLARGQLSLLSSNDAYLKGGVFDPEAMIATLRAETARAVSEGYSALRVTGEMTWALRGLPGSDRLIEYETRLNRFFPGSRCLGICQYDRRRFAPEILLDILRTHPFVVIGAAVHRNLYYVPVEEITQANRPAAELRRWLANLAIRRETEKTLWESENKYRMMVDIAAEAIVLLDRRGVIREANRRTLEISGFAREELVGKNIFRIIPLIKMEKRKIAAGFLGLLRGKPLDQSEFEFVNRRGEKIAIRVHYSLLKEGGAVSGVSVILEDVTAHRRAEAEMRSLSRFPGENPDPVMRVGSDGVLIYANPPSQPILDAWSWRKGVPLPEEWASRCGEAFAASSPLTIEVPAGDRIWSMTMTPIKDEGYVNIYLRDITERKRAEEALKESELSLRRAQQISHLGDWEWDIAGGKLAWSDELYRIWGVERDYPLTNGGIASLIHPDDRERVAAEVKKMLDSGDRADYEFRIVRPDGSIRHLRQIAEVSRERGGKAIRAFGIMQDITERTRAEEALRKNETQLSNALQMAHAGHWEYDVAADMFTFNDNFYRIFHTTAEKVGGYAMSSAEYARQFCHPDDVALVGQEVQAAIESADPDFRRQIEHRILYADGKVGYIAVRFYIVKDSLGRTVKTYGVNQDITERKRAEGELLKQHDHLEELVRERTGEIQTRVVEVEQLNRGIVNLLSDLQASNRKLEDMAGRLKDTNTELESFAYTVSHDLRAPLRAIQGFTQALLDDYAPKLDADGRDFAQRVVNAAQRMDALINDLLAYSRLTRIEFDLRPVSLGKAVAAALLHLEAEVSGKKAEVKVIDPLPAVKAHGPILAQIVENLVANALKFVSPGNAPRVTIRAEEKDGWERLWVEDNGIGIPPEYHEKIFRVFERLHGIESYPGTGIGLAIVGRGIARMGGKAGVESEPGKGSRFWIELPIAESEKKSV